jgi:hypothetical protein
MKFGDFVRNKDTKSSGIYLGPSKNRDFFVDVMVGIKDLYQVFKWRQARIELVKENEFESIR